MSIRTGNPMQYVDVSEEAISEVMRKAGRAVDGVEANAAFLGLIALAIFMRNPTMSGDALREGVKGASEWIALYTDTLGGGMN